MKGAFYFTRNSLGLGLFSPACVNGRKKQCVGIKTHSFHGVLLSGLVLGDAVCLQSCHELCVGCCHPVRCHHTVPLCSSVPELCLWGSHASLGMGMVQRRGRERLREGGNNSKVLPAHLSQDRGAAVPGSVLCVWGGE